MGGHRQSLRHFVPTRQQLVYCLLASVLTALYWSRKQLAAYYLTHTGVSGSAVHDSLANLLNSAGNNRVISVLPLVAFWAVVGLAAAAVIYESVNLLISGWNDYVILSHYTDAGRFRNYLIKRFVIGLVLLLVLILAVTFTIGVLFDIWHDLITQPPGSFLAPVNLGRELLGLAGLTLNLYVDWMLVLYLVPQFF